MPRFTTEQIHGFARRECFSPDESATVTAIAQAASGGNGRAASDDGGPPGRSVTPAAGPDPDRDRLSASLERRQVLDPLRADADDLT